MPDRGLAGTVPFVPFLCARATRERVPRGGVTGPGRGYTDLQIQNGNDRQSCVIALTNVADEERRRIRRHLEGYCGLERRAWLKSWRHCGAWLP